MNLHMSDQPQEPLVGPPGIQSASAQRAEFKTYYDRSNDDFLRNFQEEEQAPDPPPSPPPQNADRPKSPWMPGDGPVAAGLKSKVKDSESIVVSRSNPINIPYPKPM